MHGYPSPSKLDQYRKIKEKALQGKLGAADAWGCMYEAEGRNCAVGALFNQAQIEDIKSQDLNNMDITRLAETIGVKNVEAVTGFTLRELAVMQQEHDARSDELRNEPKTSRFVAWLDKQIAQEEAKAT